MIKVSYSVKESSASLIIMKMDELGSGILTLKLKNIYGEVTADMNIIITSSYTFILIFILLYKFCILIK